MPFMILGITGEGLRINDLITIQEQCGSEKSLADLPGNGIATPSIHVQANAESYYFASESSLSTMRSRAGVYFMCFCRPSPGERS